MGPLVVSQGWIAGTRGSGKSLPDGWTLATLALTASGMGSAVVYVLDEVGSAAESGPRWSASDEIAHAKVAGWAAEPTGDSGPTDGRPWRWRLTSTVSGRRYSEAVSVVYLAEDHSLMAGPWYGLEARGLLDSFAAFERVVGVPWADSVGHTAEQLILSTHPRQRGGTALDQSPSIPEPCAGSSLELAWASWRRPLSRDEETRAYVHAFDANAQYLGAWITAELGHGRPVHHKRPEFDKSRVGVWRLSGMDALPASWNETRIPRPWIAGREWFMTPTVIRVLELCEEWGLTPPVVEEAHIWPTRSRFLRAAGERLRDARAAAMGVVEAERDWSGSDADIDRKVQRLVSSRSVLDAVKDLYRIETGRFGMAGRDPRSGWARPDWGHTIRSTARVNLHRRLTKLTVKPFAIATDGLLFMSTNPDGLAFAAEIGLPIGKGLGEFSYDATAAAADVHPEVGGPVGKLFKTVGETANA